MLVVFLKKMIDFFSLNNNLNTKNLNFYKKFDILLHN